MDDAPREVFPVEIRHAEGDPATSEHPFFPIYDDGCEISDIECTDEECADEECATRSDVLPSIDEVQLDLEKLDLNKTLPKN